MRRTRRSRTRSRPSGIEAFADRWLAQPLFAADPRGRSGARAGRHRPQRAGRPGRVAARNRARARWRRCGAARRAHDAGPRARGRARHALHRRSGGASSRRSPTRRSSSSRTPGTRSRASRPRRSLRRSTAADGGRQPEDALRVPAQEALALGLLELERVQVLEAALGRDHREVRAEQHLVARPAQLLDERGRIAAAPCRPTCRSRRSRACARARASPRSTGSRCGRRRSRARGSRARRRRCTGSAGRSPTCAAGRCGRPACRTGCRARRRRRRAGSSDGRSAASPRATGSRAARRSRAPRRSGAARGRRRPDRAGRRRPRRRSGPGAALTTAATSSFVISGPSGRVPRGEHGDVDAAGVERARASASSGISSGRSRRPSSAAARRTCRGR